jgi:Tfp pilus assembly protein PilX
MVTGDVSGVNGVSKRTLACQANPARTDLICAPAYAQCTHRHSRCVELSTRRCRAKYPSTNTEIVGVRALDPAGAPADSAGVV